MMSTLQSQQRGGCLTAWLVLMLLANAFTALSNIAGSAALQRAYPNASAAVFLLLGGIGILNLLCVVALWRWKKWGFYLFIVTALVVLLINLSLGISIFVALFGLVGVVILWLLLQSRWQSFT